MVTSDTVLVLVCVCALFLLFGIRATRRKAAYVPHLAQPWLAAILMLTCLAPVPQATWGGVVGDSEGTNTDPLLMIAHAAASPLRLMLPLMPMLTPRPLLLSDIVMCRPGALENRRMDKFLDDSVSHVVPRSFLGSMEVIGDVDSVVRPASPHT